MQAHGMNNIVKFKLTSVTKIQYYIMTKILYK